MDEASISKYITETFAGVDVVVASKQSGAPEISWGDTFFFYDPEHGGDTSRFPFATIVIKDYGDFDCASNLNRPGIFRLNIGIERKTFRSLFGDHTTDLVYDFTALDRIMPHPVYGKMFWVCVLNPSDETFRQEARPLLAAAYDAAVKNRAKT